MSVYELFIADEGNLTSLKQLQDHEVVSITQQCAALMDFQNHHALIEYVIYNFERLQYLLVEKIQVVGSSPNNIINYPFENFYFEINTAILNFLASSRTFLDHMETLTARTPKDSSERLAFLKLKNEEYDNNFSYRLLGKLRNYVTHCGMPPLSFNLKKRHDDNELVVDTSLEIFIHRDKLLESRESWNAKVRQDIIEQDERFPIIMLFCEYMYSLAKIHTSYTQEFLLPQANKAKEFILNFIDQDDGYYHNNYHCGKITPNETQEGAININLSCIPASLTKKIDYFISLTSLIEGKASERFIQFGDLDIL